MNIAVGRRVTALYESTWMPLPVPVRRARNVARGFGAHVLHNVANGMIGRRGLPDVLVVVV